MKYPCPKCTEGCLVVVDAFDEYGDSLNQIKCLNCGLLTDPLTAANKVNPPKGDKHHGQIKPSSIHRPQAVGYKEPPP